MSHELCYTSVPSGLLPGDHGFCVVAQTRGLSADLASKLKSISDYRELFPPGDPQAVHNPVRYSHLRIKVGSRRLQVLSRACFAGRDYSQRTNKFVHHVVAEAGELPRGGPAWALQQPGFVETAWRGEPRYLDGGRPIPNGEPLPAVCRAWEMETGDAGWAGVLAAATTPDRPAYLIYRLGQEPLTLIGEALALLPPERRWEVTFSTYYCGMPPDVWCQWRCVIDGTEEARLAESQSGALVLRLSPDQGAAPPTELVEAARTGRRLTPAAVAAAPVPSMPRTAIASRNDTATVSARPAVREYAAAIAEPDWNEPEATPMPASTRSSFASILWLAAGLLLGMLLLFAGVLLIELATGHGILGAGAKERAALAENERLTQELERLKQSNRRWSETEADNRFLRDEIDRLQHEIDALKKPRNDGDAKNAVVPPPRIKTGESGNDPAKKPMDPPKPKANEINPGPKAVEPPKPPAKVDAASFTVVIPLPLQSDKPIEHVLSAEVAEKLARIDLMHFDMRKNLKIELVSPTIDAGKPEPIRCTDSNTKAALFIIALESEERKLTIRIPAEIKDNTLAKEALELLSLSVLRLQMRDGSSGYAVFRSTAAKLAEFGLPVGQSYVAELFPSLGSVLQMDKSYQWRADGNAEITIGDAKLTLKPDAKDKSASWSGKTGDDREIKLKVQGQKLTLTFDGKKGEVPAVARINVKRRIENVPQESWPALRIRGPGMP